MLRGWGPCAAVRVVSATDGAPLHTLLLRVGAAFLALRPLAMPALLASACACRAFLAHSKKIVAENASGYFSAVGWLGSGLHYWAMS